MIEIEGLRNLEFNIRKTNQLDENGFLTIEGVAAIADKPMEYVDFFTGKVTREVIPLEELVKSQSLIIGIPVTNGHPWEFVDNKNAGEYVKGTVIENLGIEDKKLKIRAKVYDGNLILDIQNGKDKLSIGYLCDMEETSGIADNNESYTHIQRNIKYNHLGTVYSPRAGEEAKITKFNSKDHDLAYSKGLEDKFKKNNDKGSEQMAVWKINGKDYNEQELFAEATRLHNENKGLKKQNSTLEGELTVEKKNAADAQEKINGIEQEIENRVNSKLELLNTIKENGINIDGIEKMNELDIKKAVIKANGMDDSIKDKDENFIEGVYLALMKNNSKDPVQVITGKEEKKTNSIGEAAMKLRTGGNK